MLIFNCYREESGVKYDDKCSDVVADPIQFQRCLAQLNESSFNNYMFFYGQIQYMCEYFNGTAPNVISPKLLSHYINGNFSIY